MTQSTDFLRTTLAEELRARATDRLDPDRARLMAGLIPSVLAGMAPDDLEARDGDHLFAMVVGLLGFARARPPGQPALRVFVPDPDSHGWASPHSVIEIVNDDMPFLVDSVAMVLARAGISIHLLLHPILAVGRDAAGVLTDLGPPPAGAGQTAAQASAPWMVTMRTDLVRPSSVR